MKTYYFLPTPFSQGKKIQDLLPVSLASILWQNNYFGIVSFLCMCH